DSASHCPTSCGDADSGARVRGPVWGRTHKIAARDLINVRFDPLCGPQSDIYRGPRSAKAVSCTAANLPSLTVDRFLEHHVLMTSYSEMPSSFAFIRSTERRFGRNALSQIRPAAKACNQIPFGVLLG